MRRPSRTPPACPQCERAPLLRQAVASSPSVLYATRPRLVPRVRGTLLREGGPGRGSASSLGRGCRRARRLSGPLMNRTRSVLLRQRRGARAPGRWRLPRRNEVALIRDSTRTRPMTGQVLARLITLPEHDAVARPARPAGTPRLSLPPVPLCRSRWQAARTRASARAGTSPQSGAGGRACRCPPGAGPVGLCHLEDGRRRRSRASRRSVLGADTAVNGSRPQPVARRRRAGQGCEAGA